MINLHSDACAFHRSDVQCLLLRNSSFIALHLYSMKNEKNGIPSVLRPQPEEEEGKKQERLLEGAENKIAIVGGGVSGIEAARIFLKESGRSVVIFERDDVLGGIWLRAANKESRIQVDPISYRPIDDESGIREVDASDPFDSIATTCSEVVHRLADDIERDEITQYVLFHTEVVGFEVSEDSNQPSVAVRFRDTRNNRERTQVFAQLHIRTGCLGRPIAHHGFRGQENFEGTIARGLGNDLSVHDFVGKRVIVLGLGAFAVENVRRALMGGAAAVTLLARRFNKPLFPEYATYLLRHSLQDDTPQDHAFFRAMWRRVYGVLSAAANAVQLQDVVLNKDNIRWVRGEPHITFDGGIPPMSCNVIYLAHHYGLCHIKRGEIDQLLGRVATTTAGEEIEVDIIIKAFGFDTEECLLKGHTVQDSWFVDGYANVTHNLRGDKVNGKGLLGCNVRCQNFLISYYEDAQEYERCIVRLNESRDSLVALQEMEPSRSIGDVSAVDYFTTLELSAKLADHEDGGIQRIMEENRAKRRALYEKLLPHDAFLQHDQQAWDRMARAFATKTGRDMLPYPFVSM